MISTFKLALFITYIVSSFSRQRAWQVHGADLVTLPDGSTGIIGAQSMLGPAGNELGNGNYLFGMYPPDNHGTPGHYEFEVAPNLVPPSVRKPPYEQSSQHCLGLDPFAGFQPKHNLCGDLNQGRVPLNPIGQYILDQPYPFDLIKNKTLQFLAKALPILKDEYENIPKVARGYPRSSTTMTLATSDADTNNQVASSHQHHHLLNPTHQASRLSDEQMDQINRLFVDSTSSGSGQLMSLGDDLTGSASNYLPTPPFKSKRRRRRRAVGANDETRLPSGPGRAELLPVPFDPQQMNGVTVGELGTNVSLVVSSAHQGQSRSLNELRRADSANFDTSGEGSVELSPQPSTTREAIRSIANQRQLLINKKSPANNNNMANIRRMGEHAINIVKVNGLPGRPATREQTVYSNIQTSGQIGRLQQDNQQQQQHQGERRVDLNSAPSRQQQIISVSNNNNAIQGEDLQTELRSMRPESSDAAANHATNNSNQQRQHHNQIQAKQTATERPPPPPTTTTTTSPSVLESKPVEPKSSTGKENSKADQQQQPAGPKTPRQAPPSSSSSGVTSDRKRKTAAVNPNALCNDQSGLFSTAICSVAHALVHGSSPPAPKQQSPPTWLQVLGQMASFYSSPPPPASSAESSLFSTLSSLMGFGGEEGGQPEAKSSGGAASKQAPNSSSSLYSLFSSLLSGVAPSATPTTSPGHISHGKQHNPLPATSKEEQNKTTSTKDLKRSQQQQPTADSSSMINSFAKRMAQALVYYQAAQSFSSLTDTYLPKLMSLLPEATFARRKKVTDSREQFVDTPASLAMARQANQRSQSAAQMATPCESNEMLVSPTFARNYQGQWKYVVQIPADGYFVQTVQESTCTRKKCEFTEGECQESPRWVSLLAAEIYYPNAILHPTATTTAAATNTVSTSLHQSTLAGADFAQAHSGHLMSGQPAAQQKAQASTIAATHHIQQRHLNGNPGTTNNNNANIPNAAQRLKPGVNDPLQMIDSLNTYNHNNLQAATNWANAANELSGYTTSSQLSWPAIDNPLSTSQLMGGYGNFNFQQRTGLSPAATTPAVPVNSNKQLSVPPANQMYNIYQQQQQQQPQQPTISQEYLLNLAQAALQQNPQLTYEQLAQIMQSHIQQLQLKSRKRRDINDSHQTTHQTQLIQDQGHVQYTPPAQYISPQFQQQQQLAYQQQLTQRNGQLDERMATATTTTNEMAPQIIVTNTQHSGGAPPDTHLENNQPTANQKAITSQHADINNNNNDLAGPVNQPQMQGSASVHHEKHVPSSMAGNSQQPPATPGQQHQIPVQRPPNQEVDCDGVDKYGCYVVRVYYDWFLINGACKCWKTTGGTQTGAGSTTGTTTSSNSILKRIFTG